jgi:hypothetical protein
MPASITEFVDINITLASASAAKFNFGALLGIFDHAVSTNRQEGPYSSVAEVVAAGFTSGAEAAVHAWATAVFAQDDGVDQVLIGHQDGGDADWTATLDAVEAADPTSWYITNIESRTEADILLAAAWHEAREKIYIAQSSDAAILAGTAGNVALDLQTANYNRSALIYHLTDGEPLDGAWASSGGGLNLDAPNGAGIWAYRQLEGIPFDAVSSAQAAEIFDANANVLGRNTGLNFTSKGTMASGRFIDVQTSLDWLKVRLEEKILSTFVAAPTKIPYTNGGINTLRAAVHEVFDQGVSFGHLSPDFERTLVAPDVSTVSAADKAARLLTMTGNVVLAGGIQKVVLNLTVQD